MTNKDYKNASRAALKGKWAPAVLAVIVIFLLMCPYLGIAEYPAFAGLTNHFPSWLLSAFGAGFLYLLLVVVPVETIGFPNAMKELLLTGDDKILGNSFKIAFDGWGRKVWGYILMELKLVLWMFLLIIPGIIKAFAYALTPYLLQDRPDLTPLQCIKLSNDMMKGHKFDLFYLYLSFIGWYFLALLTLGIGFLWLVPYVSGAVASFYQDVKAQYEAAHPSDGQTN